MIEIHELVIQASVVDSVTTANPRDSALELDGVQLERLVDQVAARVIEKLRFRMEGLASWD